MTRTTRSRTTTALAGMALAASVALAGCANSDPEGAADSTGAPGGSITEDGTGLLPEAEGTTAYPLTLETGLGQTTLAERPERVAVIGFSSNIDTLQVLDAVPVYSVADDSEWGWRDTDWHSKIENVDTATRRDPINFEAVAAADPDLIVAFSAIADEVEFDKLAEIAPVLDNTERVPTSGSQWKPGGPDQWKLNQVLVGEALDLSAAAEEAVAAAEASIADTVDAAGEKFSGKTITMAYDYGAEYGIEYYTATGTVAEALMLDLGFEPNPLAEEFTVDRAVSEENQAKLDADVLLMIHADDASRKLRESDAIFTELPPVKNGNYVSLAFNEAANLVTPAGEELPNAVWVMRAGASAASMPWAADVILNQWLADVDPA